MLFEKFKVIVQVVHDEERDGIPVEIASFSRRENADNFVDSIIEHANEKISENS